MLRIDFNIPGLPSWRAHDAVMCPPLPPSSRTCPALNLSTLQPGFNVNGFDLCEFEMNTNATAAECGAACCGDLACSKFTFVPPSPTRYQTYSNTYPRTNVSRTCTGKQPCQGDGICCYLKGSGPSAVRKAPQFPGIMAGSVLLRPALGQPSWNSPNSWGGYLPNPHCG